MKYFDKLPYTSEEEAKRDIDWMLKIWTEGTGLRWVVSLKEDKKLIGEMGYYDYDKIHKKAELGYKLDKMYWRKGIMSEALDAIMGFVYRETDINRLQSIVYPRNPGSFLLLEKFGFKREGLLRDFEFERGNYIDVYMYLILRREWLFRLEDSL
jgi:ribosomal-protein-alanine N-acetyltransferase